MVMAPLNVQILPHHQQNGGVGHKSNKKSNNQQRRNRSPKKFLVFPVEDVECEPGGRIEKAKVEGRIVASKLAEMNGKNGWNCQQNKRKIEDLDGKNEEENGIIGLNENEEGKAAINMPKLATEDVKKEEGVKKEGMNNGFVGDYGINSGGIISKFGLEETVKVATISTPKWTTGPMPIKAKVILLGESGVGKTSLVYSLKYGCNGLLPCNATIGAHHTNLDINAQHNGNVAIQIQLWDTAGQERFRSMIPIYLRNVNGALLVYDLTNRKSFEQIEFWIRELSRSTALEEKAPILLLIGNKNDQEKQREVSSEEGMAKASQIGADYFELAAIHTNAIRTIFLTLADKLAEKLSAKFDEVEEVDERMNLKIAGEEKMMGMEEGMEMFSRELSQLCKKNGIKCCSIS